MLRFSSKTIPELAKKLESNFSPYDLISTYKGQDFKDSIGKTLPNDNIVNITYCDNDFD